MTTRERREARAERLREWAAKRERDAEAVFEAAKPFTSDIAFNTQPGHIPLRARLIAREDRAFESLTKARGMEAHANGIERQLRSTIFSDDVDAIERLREKQARLEEKQARMKARNSEYRKEHRAELRAMSAYDRSQAVPHAGWEITNNGAEIRRCKERIVQLEREHAAKDAGQRVGGRVMVSKYASECAECGHAIDRGTPITWYRSTREAVHVECPEDA